MSQYSITERTTSEPFTYEEVRAAAHTAVRIMGKDYVYTRPDGTGQAGCYYSTAQFLAPSVGQSPTRDQLNSGSASCIIGFISRILGFEIQNGGTVSTAVYPDLFTPKAFTFMSILQTHQDTRHAWGEAYTRAVEGVSGRNEFGDPW